MNQFQNNLPQFMDITHAAAYFGVTKYFLRKGVLEGRIAHAFVGNRYMIDVNAFQRQMNSNVDYHSNQNRNK